VNISTDIEIREITDFSNARKNPYAEKIKKHGFSVTVNYSPNDVTKIIEQTCNQDIDLLGLDPEEVKAFEKYKKSI
jgi:uncharacterized protein YfbU (UPF0304 family)